MTTRPPGLAQHHSSESQGCRYLPGYGCQSTSTAATPWASGAVSGHKSLHRAGQFEVEARALLGRDGGFAGQGTPDVTTWMLSVSGVGDGAPAIGRGEVHAVGHGPAPIRTGIDPGQPVLDAQDAADVARIAVGVPAAWC